jgi:hypothetical protein
MILQQLTLIAAITAWDGDTVNAYDVSLERGRLGIVLATVIINVVAVSLLTFAPWSDWRTGAALDIVDNCLFIGFTLVRRDALLGRFLLFGLVVGFTELRLMRWLVDYTRTLDYSVGGGPMTGGRRSGCRWSGKSWQCNSDMSDCDCGNGSARLVCLRSDCFVRLIFRSTRRWRAEFIGGSTVVAA